ncbi:MAG: GNAT family N-acetyltransferase [Flavitalea sp.]
MISFRTMDRGDIPEGLRLCRSANWNQLQRDWEIFLTYGPEDCRVAIHENKVVGTVTAIRYDHFFSWIGMVLVDPSQQRKGIGSGLLHEALDLLKDEETIKLDATPAGREVYLQLEFKDEYPLSRMSAVINAEKIPASTARPMLQSDLHAVAEYDSSVFGAGRQSLLEWFFEGASSYAFIIDHGNGIEGYCLGRKGQNFNQVGPVVARNWHIARELVSAALAAATGEQVVIDTMHHEPEWLSWLGSIGFTEQRPFMRMYKGTNQYTGIPEMQFAIAGPEFG